MENILNDKILYLRLYLEIWRKRASGSNGLNK